VKHLELERVAKRSRTLGERERHHGT